MWPSALESKKAEQRREEDRREMEAYAAVKLALRKRRKIVAVPSPAEAGFMARHENDPVYMNAFFLPYLDAKAMAEGRI